jgi:uncharacterized protein YceK
MSKFVNNLLFSFAATATVGGCASVVQPKFDNEQAAVQTAATPSNKNIEVPTPKGKIHVEIPVTQDSSKKSCIITYLQSGTPQPVEGDIETAFATAIKSMNNHGFVGKIDTKAQITCDGGNQYYCRSGFLGPNQAYCLQLTAVRFSSLENK